MGRVSVLRENQVQVGSLDLIFSNRYTRVSEIDGEQVWRQLCENVSTAAQEFCSFLEYYIATSTKLVPSLGPDEYEEERTVNSAATIQDVWSALVAVANDKVLRQLRLQFPGEQRIYILRYTTRGGQDAGPAGRVGRVSLPYPKETYTLLLILLSLFQN
jgi:hypothetical protein